MLGVRGNRVETEHEVRRIPHSTIRDINLHWLLGRKLSTTRLRSSITRGSIHNIFLSRPHKPVMGEGGRPSRCVAWNGVGFQGNDAWCAGFHPARRSIYLVHSVVQCAEYRILPEEEAADRNSRNLHEHRTQKKKKRVGGNKTKRACESFRENKTVYGIRASEDKG